MLGWSGLKRKSIREMPIPERFRLRSDGSTMFFRPIGPLTREKYNEKCRFAPSVGYGVGAELNFLARPLAGGT
jgi:hypothetical protein